MNNYKCIIAYSGSDFFGFKKTKMGPSIEETLQKCLEKILQHPIQIQGASLTDSGVHAMGQTINFFSDRIEDLGKLLSSMRSLLPKSIAPLHIEKASPSFHPSLDATSKKYTYSICNLPTQLPFHREFSWHCPLPLDLEAMQKAAGHLLGKQDFSALANERYEDPVRHLTRIEIHPFEENRIRIEVEGDRFLYKMARNIVGTLIHVGYGKINAQNLPNILKKGDRRLAGMTAPAYGLTLKKVYY